MNHYDARQDSSTGRWHYTRLNGRHAHAVGHCTDDGGHDEPAEACACFRGWLIENANYRATAVGGPKVCAVAKCGEPTDRLAIPQMGAYYFLCEDHCNPLGLDSVFPPVGSFFAS